MSEKKIISAREKFAAERAAQIAANEPKTEAKPADANPAKPPRKPRAKKS